MRRRRFLVVLGASLPLAGCLSRGSTPDSGPPSETPEPTGTPTDPGASRSDAFALGETTDDHNPHGLSVENRGDTVRAIDLRVTDAEAGETLLDRSYRLGGGEGVDGDLRGPAIYEVRVAVPDAGTERVVTIDHFDTCNSYGTTVAIAPDGTVEPPRTWSTLAACGTEPVSTDTSDG